MRTLKHVGGPEKLYSIEGPWNIGDPVHENLCLAAIYQQRMVLNDVANANFNVLWASPALNEYLRGVFWNDDPEVLMFYEVVKSDSVFSNGAAWYAHFQAGKEASSNDLSNLTGRSHFWDMQFLHGMACVTGEPPATTRQRALMWAEFMYKVSVGQPVSGSKTTDRSNPNVVAETLLNAVQIPPTPSAGQSTIASYFSNASDPTSSATIGYLLTRNDPYDALKMGRRAIGSVMHLIQDSFARGHTRRVLLNPDDVVSASVHSITFKPGTWGQWGNVITFHAYHGQDEDVHSSFDSYGEMDPTNLNSFNGLVGGRDAISNCAKLLGYYANRMLWENGPKALLEQIFALAPNATVSNTEVNRIPLTGVSNTGVGAVGGVDPHYVLLEGGATVPAFIVEKNYGWAAPPAGAGWISPQTGTQGGTGQTYTYRVTIDLTGYNPKSVILSGSIAGDDAVQGISVNGKPFPDAFGLVLGAGGFPAAAPKPSYGALSRFHLQGKKVFTAGTNTIDFTVYNVNGPTGLMVAFEDAVGVALHQ